MKSTNLIEHSRRAVELALNLKANLNEFRQMAGVKSVAQCELWADRLLNTLSPMASVVTAPAQLAAPQRPPTDQRPHILGHIADVLGTKTLTPEQIATVLLRRGLLTKSQRSIRYVSDLLSRNSDGKGTQRFTRVRRGFYRIAGKRRLVYRKA